MTYSTLLVHLDASERNARLLDVTASIAAQYQSKIIGIAACQPVQLGECDGFMDGALAVAERDIVDDELSRAKAEFYAHSGVSPHLLEWRSIPTLVNVAHIVAEHARCADLVVTGIASASSGLSAHADTSDLLIRAGRPVLVVPKENTTADFRSIMVAWSDTRESRRAICDALPMLKHADRVTIVAVSAYPEDVHSGIDDVLAWLARHDVDADRIIRQADKADVEDLASAAADLDADLIVAGAYGHGRMREWVFGGVTRDMLLRDRRCTFLSH